MVRIGLPAAAAAAVMTLAACSSLSGYTTLDGSGTLARCALFPPPPPVLSDGATDPAGDAAVDGALAELRNTLTRLSTDLEASRQHFAELEAEMGRTRARIEQLLEREQPTLGALSVGKSAPAEDGIRRPFVRIRLDQPSVDYVDALNDAVQSALAQLPDAEFDAVGVTSLEDSEAVASEGRAERLRAEEVMALLVDMGVAPDRLTLSWAADGTAKTSELRIYIR